VYADENKKLEQQDNMQVAPPNIANNQVGTFLAKEVRLYDSQ